VFAFLPAVFGSVLAWVGASLIARLLLGLGVGVLTYVGVSALMDTAYSSIVALYADIPAQILGTIGVLHLDDAIKVIFSAISIRLTISSMSKLKFAPGA